MKQNKSHQLLAVPNSTKPTFQLCLSFLLAILFFRVKIIVVLFCHLQPPFPPTKKRKDGKKALPALPWKMKAPGYNHLVYSRGDPIAAFSFRTILPSTYHTRESDTNQSSLSFTNSGKTADRPYCRQCSNY